MRKDIDGRDIMKKIILIFMISLIAISSIACMNSSKNREVGDSQDSIEVDVDDKELLIRSEDISDWVVELYGIDDATTIVFNDDAYIAVVMALDYEFSHELRENIVYQVGEKDSLIENIYVTDNSKTFNLISDVIFNLLQGESYDSQVKQIYKIMNRF